MADRPINFTAAMIEALLAGRKTQTRRILRNPEFYGCPTGDCPHDYAEQCLDAMEETALADVPFARGDRLWVRESYYQPGRWRPIPGAQTKGHRQKWEFVPVEPLYSFHMPASFRKGRHSADPETLAWHKRLGRFMPRRYSRLTLLVKSVRLEPLQDISEEDAIAEGIERHDKFPDLWKRGPLEGDQNTATVTNFPKLAYRSIWEGINGPGSWHANPWVIVITFELQKGNIDHG